MLRPIRDVQARQPGLRRRQVLGISAASILSPTGLGMAQSHPTIAAKPTPPSMRTADVSVLRAYGARLDGETDDRAAFQAVIDSAGVHIPDVLALSGVAFELPACCVLLGGPLRTGSCNTAFRGAGQNLTLLLMQPGGSGIVVHGDRNEPSKGYLQLENLSIVDGNAEGSGSIGVAAHFAEAAPQPAMTWQGVTFRKWTRPSRITNCPRNWHCENVTLFGPDFAIQEAAGFEIISEPEFKPGCFTYVFLNVFVANYNWGWHYSIGAPLEGQRFYSCTCYNGWGMVRVRVGGAGGDEGNADRDYHSLLWDFVDCDWQGLGYALDLARCRDVQVRGGFFIADLNRQHRVIPDNRSRRRYMSFSACEDVLLNDVELDVLPDSEPGLSLIYVDSKSENFRSFNTIIRAYAPLWAAFEFGDEGSNSSVGATMGEFDTSYRVWAGGTKVGDANSNQLDQSLIRAGGWGDVTTGGVWSVSGTSSQAIVDKDGHLHVGFPPRPGGAPWFSVGPPMIDFEAIGLPERLASCRLSDVSRDGFLIYCSKEAFGLALDIRYTATGR